VVAIPDEKWGEVGRAYVLPQPGCELPPAGEITAWCRERLAPYKVPKEYLAVHDFPRTAAGKIQKHLLVREHAS
jgi:fatty-acyl-CoA synthase